MDKKSLLGMGVVVLFASFLCMATPARAEGPDEYSRPRQKWGADKQQKFDKLIQRLGLSEEQVVQLEAHKQAKMKSREKLYAKLGEQKKALKQELEKPQSDNAKIRQIADSIKQVQSELVDERIKGILEIKAILTTEQYAEFKEKMGRYREKKMLRHKGDKGSDAWGGKSKKY